MQNAKNRWNIYLIIEKDITLLDQVQLGDKTVPYAPLLRCYIHFYECTVSQEVVENLTCGVNISEHNKLTVLTTF